LEMALAQGEGFSTILRTSSCAFDSLNCPRSTFVSDWFRPPTFV
jgi:hypothetical protein